MKIKVNMLALFVACFLTTSARADNPIKIKVPTFVPDKPVVEMYQDFLSEGKFCRVNADGQRYSINPSPTSALLARSEQAKK
ncbi:MAG: hypothetical protein IT292_03395 [Deltaproteobacteria bacterium]|nr:hypothetical protein [Deltaproteobacteria bacterium]